MKFSWLIVCSLGVLFGSYYHNVHAKLLMREMCPAGNAPAAMKCPGDSFTLVTYNISQSATDESKRYLHTICVNLDTMCNQAVEPWRFLSGDSVVEGDALVQDIATEEEVLRPDALSPIRHSPRPTVVFTRRDSRDLHDECDNPMSVCDSKCPETTIEEPGIVSLCCRNTKGIKKDRLRCAKLAVDTLPTGPGMCAGA